MTRKECWRGRAYSGKSEAGTISTGGQTERDAKFLLELLSAVIVHCRSDALGRWVWCQLAL